jgi:mediator of RNA polymerase II transcription subunit 16
MAGLQFALSPSYCSAVQIRNDGKVKWKRLDYHLGDIGSSKDDRKQFNFHFGASLTACSTLCRSGCSIGNVLLYRSDG